MAYQALYRTYRPQLFRDVVGQEVVVKTLQNAIANNKISHAYLFAGPRGTGKTTVARIFAKTLNCENPVLQEPCDKCRSCYEIADGISPGSIRSLDFTGTKATRAGSDLPWAAVHHRVNGLQVGLPLPLGADMRMADAHTGTNGLAADLTFGHLLAPPLSKTVLAKRRTACSRTH